MKILLTGANGYIGKRILPVLVQNGHQVVCGVRDANRFTVPKSLKENVEVIEMDCLDISKLSAIPKDIDGAYYLIHSMSSADNYEVLELSCAMNFRKAIEKTSVKHVVYLSGMVNDTELSKHLTSRKAVEDELAKGDFNFTTFRAGIIIGSGSASFEIVRDLVEKLPLMVAPKWLKTRCQPIGIADVIQFLTKALFNPKVYNQNYDIGGPDILSYKEMLLGYAKVRKLRLHIISVPVMTPKLSSYWLYFITSTSYQLASALVSSMKNEVIARDSNINEILGIKPIGYMEALERTFTVIQDEKIASSWKDSLISGVFKANISEYLEVPKHGVFIDQRRKKMDSRENTLNKIWQIGGDTGWYHADWLWEIRGIMDQFVGGVGLRRGRTSINSISPGDAIDFWRVLYADKEEGRLLLFAEMKLPGEAWLEFKVDGDELVQTATFRPRGIAGRLYWYAVFPFHGEIFSKMLAKLANDKAPKFLPKATTEV